MNVQAKALSLMVALVLSGVSFAQSTAESTRALAEQGNAAAQMQYGRMLDEGDGIAADRSEAAKWYQRSADQGNSVALRRLGLLQSEGKGVKKDKALGFSNLLLAARLGDATAQSLVGEAYMLGQGTKKNVVEGYTWLNIAMLGKEPSADKKRRKYRNLLKAAELTTAYQSSVEWAPIVFNQTAGLKSGQSIAIDKFYPADRGKLEGEYRIELRVCVDDQGSVVGSPSTIKSSGSEGFDLAAHEWAKAAEYRPQINRGVPEHACATFAVKFSGDNSQKTDGSKNDWIVRAVTESKKSIPQKLRDDVFVEDVSKDFGDGIVYKVKYQGIDLNSNDAKLIQTLKASLPFVPAENVCRTRKTVEVIDYGVRLRYQYVDKNDVPIAESLIDQSYCATVPGSSAGGAVRKPPKLDMTFLPDSDDFYPAAAKRDNIMGKVQVRTCVGSNGRLLSEPIVIGPVHPLLDDAAIRWSKSAVYYPGTENGKSAPMCFRYNVNFSIVEGGSSLFETIVGTLLLIAL